MEWADLAYYIQIKKKCVCVSQSYIQSLNLGIL